MNGKMTKRLRLGTVSRKAHRKAKAAYTHGNQGQNPKPVKARSIKPREIAKPTWPSTLDQNLQGRPVIVLHPVRQYLQSAPLTPRGHRNVKASWPTLPKHVLDARAVNA